MGRSFGIVRIRMGPWMSLQVVEGQQNLEKDDQVYCLMLKEMSKQN
jgi:hypothetical protein